jgi:hypothetical protein
MNVLAAKAQPLPHHPGYAWIFVILFGLGITLYAISVVRRSGGDRPKDNKEPPDQPTIYDFLQPRAKKVKAVLQMAIGIITVAAVGWRYFDTLGDGDDPTRLLLNGIGIGLAAAAAIELAYTLFTDGPDEALDPLMLGVASTLLLKLSGLKGTLSLSQVGALAILGLLLIGLFAARLMLAESTDEQPKVWWIRRLSTPPADPRQPSPSPNATAPQPQTPQAEGPKALSRPSLRTSVNGGSGCSPWSVTLRTHAGWRPSRASMCVCRMTPFPGPRSPLAWRRRVTTGCVP